MQQEPSQHAGAAQHMGSAAGWQPAQPGTAPHPGTASAFGPPAELHPQQRPPAGYRKQKMGTTAQFHVPAPAGAVHARILSNLGPDTRFSLEYHVPGYIRIRIGMGLTTYGEIAEFRLFQTESGTQVQASCMHAYRIIWNFVVDLGQSRRDLAYLLAGLVQD